MISSSSLSTNVFLVPEFLDERHEVGGVNLAGVQRHAGGQIGDTDDFFTPLRSVTWS